MLRHLTPTTSHEHRQAAVEHAAVTQDERLIRPAGQAEPRPAQATCGGESGVVAIEFALTLPIILIFLFAIIQFGQLFNHVNDSNQMAADGVRYAAVDGNPGGSTLQAYILERGDTQHLRDSAKVCITFPESISEVGYPVKVSVSSSFTLIPLLGGATLSLNGHATMRIERPPTKYFAGCS